MRTFKVALLAVGMLALSACAAGKGPFMTDADWEIQQKILAEFPEYRDLRVIVSGGTVYIEGEAPNVPDRNRVVAAAQRVPGVKAVFEDLYLTEVGTPGPDIWK